MREHAMLWTTVMPLLLTAVASTDTPKAKEGAGKAVQPEPLLTLKAHTDYAFRVRFSPNGKWLGTASADKTAALWDANTGMRQRVFRGHTGYVISLTFCSSSKRLATGSHDGTIRVWDITTGRETVLDGQLGHWFAVAFIVGGNYLVSGGYSAGPNRLQVWDAQTGRPKVSLLAEPERGVTCGACSRDDKRLASATLGGTVTVWELVTRRHVLSLDGHANAVNSLEWSPDNRWLASGDTDGTVRLWDVASGKAARVWRGHKGHVHAVTFTPDGRYLFAAATDFRPCWQQSAEVRLWDTKTGGGKQVLHFTEKAGGVWDLSISPDGSRLATAHGDGSVKVWSVMQLLGQRVGH
jgi:WD40 repeat protein